MGFLTCLSLFVEEKVSMVWNDGPRVPMAELNGFHVETSSRSWVSWVAKSHLVGCQKL